MDSTDKYNEHPDILKLAKRVYIALIQNGKVPPSKLEVACCAFDYAEAFYSVKNTRKQERIRYSGR